VGFIEQLLGRIRSAPSPAPSSSPKSAPVDPLPSRSKTTPMKSAATTPVEPREKEGGKLGASFRHGLVDARFLDLDVDRRFVEQFDQALKAGPDSMALPSSTAFDVMKLLDETPVDEKRVESAITADAALTEAVTALVASPLHRGEKSPESLTDSIKRLGASGLRLVLYEAALRAACVKGRPFEAFSDLAYKHSLLTAQLARSIATTAQLDADAAYLAGLFHDVGVFAVVGAARQLASGQNRPVSKQTVLRLVSRDAAAFDQRVAERWKLPAAVAAAVVHRREPAGAGDHAPLAAATQLANDVCRHFGAWAPQKAVDFAAHPALKLLKIEADKVPARADVMAMAEKVEQVAPLH
jgi:HD-like signal output (HDOD) protein